MSANKYLEKRYQTWHFVKDVPLALRDSLGKKRFVLSLKTHDLHQARLRRPHAEIAFQKAIEQAARVPAADALVKIGLEYRTDLTRIDHADVTELRARLKASDPEHWRDPHRDDQELGARAKVRINAEWAIGDHADHLRDTLGDDAASLLHDVAYGRATPLGHHVEAWLTEGGTKGPLRERTKLQYRADIQRLIRWLETTHRPATVEAVTEAVAGHFITETMVGLKVDPATANRWITAVSSYWRWLRKRAGVKANPWTGQRVAKPSKVRGESKRSFTDAEVAALMAGNAGTELNDLMRVAALSGMRLGEIYALTVADTADGWFDLRRSKTPAGQRRVPVHGDLATIVTRRTTGKPTAAFLFHEAGDPDSRGERSAAASKRFARYRRAVNVHAKRDASRYSDVDFHSFRRWFVTKARQAGHDRAAVAAVVGHEAGNLTDDVYSAGPTDAQRRAVVQSVRLPCGNLGDGPRSL